MILLAVYSISQWTMLLRLARRLQAKGENIATVYFGSSNETGHAIQVDTEALGCGFYSHEAYTEQVTTDVVRGPAGCPDDGSEISAVLPVEHPYRVLIRKQIEGARAILDQSKASLLVVCEDGPGGDSPLILSAKLKGLSVVVVPFGVGESRDYDNFLNDKNAEGALNLVPDGALGLFIRQKAAHWIRKTAFGDALLFPASFLASRVLENLDIPLPWAVQGGHGDCIAVESDAMHRHYLREGIPDRKLIDTGTVYCDEVYETIYADGDLASAFKSQGKIFANRTSILIALPPSYHSTRASFSEFATYEEACTALLDFCGSLPNTEVTITLHPGCSAEAVNAIRRTGVKISTEWIISLIPKHDIFVTDFSSTIRWAIAARKPVVNYDIYKFGLETYATARGVITSQYFTNVKDSISRLVGASDVYTQFAELQRSVSRDWGVLDGKNFDRIYELLRSKIAV